MVDAHEQMLDRALLTLPCEKTYHVCSYYTCKKKNDFNSKQSSMVMHLAAF